MSQASIHAKLTPSGARQGLDGVAGEANLIPKVDKDGIIQGVAVPDATTVTKGKVLLAVLGGSVPGTVVQADDPRLTPGGIDHGGLAGLGDDDHTQYLLLVGRAAGQVVVGGTAAADPLLLRATSDAGGGPVILEVSPGVESARVLASGEFIVGDTSLVGGELMRVAGGLHVDAEVTAIDRVSGGATPGKNLVLEATFDPVPGPVIFRGEPGTEYGRFEETAGALLIGVGGLIGSELFRVAGQAHFDTDAVINAGVKGGLGPGDELLLRATDDVVTSGRIRFEKDGTGAEYGRFTTDNGGALLLGATTVVGSENLRVAGAALFEGSIGFQGATPIVTPAAYTQTYATADRTHNARTAATLTDNSGGAAADGTIAAITGGNNAGSADLVPTQDAIVELADQINKLIADQQDTAQLLNSVIDDLKSYGLLQ